MAKYGEFNFAITILVFCLSLANCFLVDDGLQKISTPLGEIHGFQMSGEFDGQKYIVNKFLGIPFAEPPVGDLRFKKSVPLRHFPSPLKALAHGPACLKPRGNASSMSEDCLTLNIYAPYPHGPDVLRKPVMVWIYGGGFSVGESESYNAEVIAGFSDVIVVTLNYRLGPLGFLTTSDDEAPGNYGLWDQHLAIRWVHENIASFGGDTANVTIFGESAGSSSVIFQTLYAGNRGLFHRAIAESGTLSAWAVSDTDSVFQASIDFAKSLGCTAATHADLMACLRRKSSSELLAATKAFKISYDLHPSWIPVYDQEFAIEEPVKMLANAKAGSPLYSFFREVDLMIGWNNYDGCLYFRLWMAQFNMTTPESWAVSPGQLNFVYVPRITEIGLAERPTATNLGLVRQEYSRGADTMTPVERLMTLCDMGTDAFLAAPSMRTVKAHANPGSSTYIYRFSARSPFTIGGTPPFLDKEGIANHADELIFVFGMKPVELAVRGQVLHPTPTQIRLSKAMMTLWSNFAKSGNPNKPRNVKQFYDIEWDKYELGRARYLEITSDMTSESVRDGPSFPGIDFWNHLLPPDQWIN